jgi:hypothetical protein
MEIGLGPTLVGTELDATGNATHSGFVDLLDITQGVRGWVVNHADPMEPVQLHLCVGDHVVAETFADGDRADISNKLGRPARAGFAFDADALLAMSGFMDDPDDPVSIRVAETGHWLASAGTPPTIGEIIAMMRAGSTPEPKSTIADFEFLLDELRAAADILAEEALRPLPENLQGYIETVAVDTTGQVWFMGWMKRGHVQEFSAVVVERRKYAAAVAVMSYGRDDLPQDSCGIVGLISSSWRPSSATADMHVFFGNGGRFHLRSHAPLRIVTSSELVNEYEGVRDRCFGQGRAIALQRMLTALENWLPTRTAAQWFATECSIDRILLVPGLGCLVEGWVMSPMKRIEGLRLRVGASVMSADPESLYWKPRPDLLSAFPGSERMVDRAGFVGLFAGDAEPEDFADPVLKVIFQGGSSANWSINANVFRRLGHSASVEDALLFFPALQDEEFFPRFAEAAIRAERAAMNPPVALSIARSRRAMVFVLPEDRCDLFLLFEELAQQCRTGGGIEAVAFIAASKSNRSDALWLFREFQATHGAQHNIACSLLVIDDAAQAFALLPEILRDIGANRFLFVGAGVFLRPAGWQRARQALMPGATDLVFFGLEAEEFEQRDAAGGVTARCFAWSAGHLARWALSAPSFMGGYYRDNGLFQSKSAHVVHHNAACCMRTLLSTRVQEGVNATVYALSGHHGGSFGAGHAAAHGGARHLAQAGSRQMGQSSTAAVGR